MTNEMLFIIASFIVLVIALLTLKKPLSCVLILSLLINLALILNHSKGQDTIDFTVGKTPAPIQAQVVAKPEIAPQYPNELQSPDVYGPFYRTFGMRIMILIIQHIMCQRCTLGCPVQKEIITLMRPILLWHSAGLEIVNRTDGWASKDANYYKYSFRG